MTDLGKLSPEALRAAMRGGTEGWGEWGSIEHHALYVEPCDPRSRRRKCGCGCKGRITHRASANGVCMGQGCELSMRRFAKRPLE